MFHIHLKHFNAFKNPLILLQRRSSGNADNIFKSFQPALGKEACYGFFIFSSAGKIYQMRIPVVRCNGCGKIKNRIGWKIRIGICKCNSAWQIFR